MEPPTVGASAGSPRLTAERCRSLLAAASGGHLALSQGALPLVVPVTCAVEGDNLLVRAGLGLIGKVPATLVDDAELDRIAGSSILYVDDHFPTAMTLGHPAVYRRRPRR